MNTSKYALAALLVLLPGCDKQNVVTQETAGDGLGAQCSGADDQGCGVGAVCALGYCRSGCTTDAECPTGAICVGSRPPFGCTLPEESACATDDDCPDGLVCGVDDRCRHPCGSEGDCPRNEHACVTGTCVSRAEQGAEETWFSCTTGATQCDLSGEAPRSILVCNMGGPGLTPLHECPAGTRCGSTSGTLAKICVPEQCCDEDFCATDCGWADCATDSTCDPCLSSETFTLDCFENLLYQGMGTCCAE